MVTMSLYQQLENSLVTCPLGDQEFLPLSKLEEKITTDAVRTQLPWSTLLINRGLPDKIFQCAKKVFAILVLMGEPGSIRGVIEDGLTDEHLPLSREMGNDGNALVSGGTTFKSFATWPSNKVKEFLEKQWHVQAPVLDMAGKHIDLDRKCALPFKAVNQIYTTILIRVYKATIHPAHQVGLKGDGTEIHIAIKEFSDGETFKKEKDNLREIQLLRHRHLIKLVATCQRGSTYYVMFPWANGGSLTDLWKRDDLQRGSKLILWSLRQMLGLIDALKALHSKNCRHGDLKPDNILHFKDEEILIIADVGISKFHREVTKIRTSKTNTPGTTRSYEAPEAQPDNEDPRSRVYDMWSMGCIFLEFVVWLLYGYRGVRSFRRSRKSTDPMIDNGSFYARLPEGSVVLHSNVSMAIDALMEDPPCRGSPALADIVELTIQNLLLVEVSGRAQASAVYERLKRIVGNAEQQPKYLLEEHDPPLPPHPFFRTGSRQNSASTSASSP